MRVARAYVGELLSNTLRQRLTQQVHKQYSSRGAYYALQADHPELDNPDQRIVTDIRMFYIEASNVLSGGEAGLNPDFCPCNVSSPLPLAQYS